MIRLVIAACAVSFYLAGCGFGTCPGICPDPYAVTFVDAAGAPVNDVYGVVTTATGSTTAFECGMGIDHMLDAGMTATCMNNIVTLHAYSDLRPVTISAQSGNKRFSGEVVVKWSKSESGHGECGGGCQVGSATVVLQ